MSEDPNVRVFPRDTNQTLTVAQFCIEMLGGGQEPKLAPSPQVLDRTTQFYVDSVACALSARALLADEGLGKMFDFHLAADAVANSHHPLLCTGGITQWGATVYGSDVLVNPAVAAFLGSFAARAWDANGTSFAYYKLLNHIMGEFGHNDFYDAAIAACQLTGRSGKFALTAMILLDEIRTRLGSVFSLKDRHLDHVFHGGIATAFVVGVILGLTAEQIEQAVGMYVAHYVPTRANRSGGAEIADSKGAAAAIATENAFNCVLRVRAGFAGPRDIFRIEENILRLLGGPNRESKVFARADGKIPAEITTDRVEQSPFDLVLTHTGDGFAIMQMHLKLALYEHQSAGALAGLLLALRKFPNFTNDGIAVSAIRVGIYNPAADIICQPARWNPTTREAADHSAPYLIARLLHKIQSVYSLDWAPTMLNPQDFSEAAIHDPAVRRLMQRISIHHRPEFDDKYPEGIPTEVEVELVNGSSQTSGLVMFPPGHASYDGVAFGPTDKLLAAKWHLFGLLAFANETTGEQVLNAYGQIASLDAAGLRAIHSGYELVFRPELMN